MIAVQLLFEFWFKDMVFDTGTWVIIVEEIDNTNIVKAIFPTDDNDTIELFISKTEVEVI